MPVLDGTGLPSLSQIVHWNTEHLQNAAQRWSAAAEQWEDHFTIIHRKTLSPGGTAWEGAGAEAAQERTFADLVKVRGAADSLQSAAKLARSGAHDLSWAKRQALDAIAEAEDAGFAVAEDLSVTDRSMMPLLRGAAARHTQAETLAVDIRVKAQHLAAIDKEVAGKITAAVAPLRGVSFAAESNNQGAKPTVQAVDYKQFKDAPIPEPGIPDDPGSATPPSPATTAKNVQDAIKELPQGNDANVRVVRDPQQLRRFEEWIAQHGTKFQSDPPYRGGQGSEYRLPDGTEVRVGPSKQYGTTVDLNLPEDQVTLPDGKTVKLHLDATKGGDIMLPTTAIPEPPAVKAPAPPEAAPAEPAGPRASVGQPVPIGGMGGPGVPLGPQIVHLPGSINHPFPILGEDDPTENPRDFEGHH